VEHVELAGLVLAERRDRERRVHELSGRPRLAALRGRPDPARAEVAVEEAARVLRKPPAAITITAGDRAAERVIVLEHRQGQRSVVARGGRVEAGRALHAPPAVVLAAEARRRLEVHLFASALADVGDEQITGLSVEAEAPRVAQAVGPDLRHGALRRAKRIRRRDRVRKRAVDVQAQDLAEERAEVLGAIVGVAAAAAVAEAQELKPVTTGSKPSVSCAPAGSAATTRAAKASSSASASRPVGAAMAIRRS